MTDKIIEFPKTEQKKSVEFIGPFVEKWKVAVEGFEIKKLSAIVMQNGNILLSLDNRFMVEGTPEEMEKWLWIVANALAIGEGYPWYGAQNKDVPFAPKIIGLSEAPNE
jgi:hypothetical protein